MIGKTLAHYEIIAKLGQGGMGEVYRASDPKLGRDVALKILPDAFARDRERLKRFEREARILASLNHPNIAAIYGFEEDAGRHFLVMELVDGEDLSAQLRKGRLEPKAAVEVASQIARALEEAHGKGIVHRDLKPANIKRSSDGSIKVLDFGLASMEATPPASSALADSPTITGEFTQAGTILGTAPYMSPEQAKGQPAEARTDTWAFGCVLFELLTGNAAFKGDTVSGTIARILEREPDWEALPSSVPASIRTLLRRCLAKDARQRMHSFADIRIELDEAFDKSPDVAASPVASSPAKLTISVILAFAVGVTLGASWLLRDRTSLEARSSTRLVIPARDVVPLPECGSALITKDGDYVVYIAAAQGSVIGQGMVKRANLTQLYSRPIDKFEATPIEGTVGATMPFLSPDGEWIGFQSSDLQVKKVPRNGGTPTVILTEIPTAMRGATWAEDDQIYFSGSATGIGVVDAAGGEARLIAVPNREAGEKTIRFPNSLPGSTHLLVTVGNSEILSYDDATVAVLTIATGELKELVRGGTNPRYASSGHILYGRAGKLFAVPFDLESLETTGPPVEVLDGIVMSDGYGSAQFDVSNDGTLVYIAGGPEEYSFDLFLVDRSGAVERIPQPARHYGNIQTSPDGKRLALSVLGANASLWVYALERGTMSRIISGWDNHSPVWHPNGVELAFGSNRSQTGFEGVWRISATGSTEPAMVPESSGTRYPSDWSRDGRWIAATHEATGGGSDIWFIDTANVNPTPSAIRTSAAEYSPAFSPDDRYVAYVSDESGETEVYVQRFPTTGERWKISENGGGTPVWAPDGTAIYYLGDRQIVTVPIVLEPDFRPDRARTLCELELDDATAFDVFPSGDRFAVIGRQHSIEGRRIPIARPEGGMNRIHPARDPHVHVVSNWFTELESLAPR